MTKKINRRNFLAGSVLAPTLLPKDIQPTAAPVLQKYDLMVELKKYKKIDAYCTAPLQMELSEKMFIEKVYVGQPMLWKKWTPEEFREANNEVIRFMKKYPGKVVGQITLNPLYPKESLQEIDRCVDQGMVGTRLYYQAKISDPIYGPVIEKLADLKMIIFIHGEAQRGVGGYKMKYDIGRPSTISRPEDFVEAARRYPEAMFQFAHLGGGGDWEYMCKALAGSPNVFVDVGGSNNEEGMIDFAVETLGASRLLFGSDNSHIQAVGRVLSAAISEKQKQMIFYDNYATILKKGGYHAH